MDILFYIVPIFIALVFIFIIAMIFSPKLRGKMMSQEIKATKHMLDYSKADLKDIIKTSADTKITSQKEVLDNYEDIIKENTIREANINADKIEILSKALKDGLTKEKKYCQECGHTIDIDAKYCSNCGHKQ